MIVVVGEALVDLVVAPPGATATALTDGGIDVGVAATLGGAPFNVARTCGRLGADVVFVGSVSDDRFGVALLERLGRDGVDLGSVQRVSSPTTLAVAELAAHGSARYRFYVDGTSAPSLTSSVLPPGVAALVTGGLALVLEPMATTVTELVVAQPRDVLVVVDLNCRPGAIADRDAYLEHVERVLTRADVVKVSDEDVAFAWPDHEPAEAARLLLDRGVRAVLFSAGAAGVTATSAAGSVVVPSPAVDVVDTIGAGDALTGAFVAWCRARGVAREHVADLAVLTDAVAAANAVASIVCTRRGADPPWRHELSEAGW